ncbi:alkaline phosphatase [uncultured Alistipes sp.]|uniref:alkaline phosphatase n=3 Tax=uncultured Alistipes sp. TaxID=538949 RepID=UPI0025D8B0F2|nr:alkaline phosphatase [uncultured Alistipes sp.]
MRKILRGWLLLAALCFCTTAAAQRPMLIHSHNDYNQRAPFWQAYAQQVYSIEADVFLHKGQLLVGHDTEDLSPDMTFESLYVEPLVTLFKRNGGRAWKGSDEHLQLMIELKSKTEPALKAVAAVLDRYPGVFDPAVNPHAVRIAVTGRVPAPADFAKYPAYIRFDGEWDVDYTPAQLERVALVSADFGRFSQWNGKGSIIASELEKLEAVIDRAHALGKPVRFWGAPEGVTVYYTFYNMGVDYINTDHLEVCAGFFSDFGNKNFQIGERRTAAGGVTGTKRLDKTTRDFRGFQNDKLQLSKGVGIYTPTYKNDGKEGKIKNVIYLIGDGMGLTQVVAAAYANKGLTMLQMKYIGLQQNNALDAFTTDSAAGGSALATGEGHANRHISMSPQGVAYPSLSDYFHDKGLSVGVLTLGNVVDATPTAFYGHSVERDNADELTRYLLDGRLDLLCGSGIREFTRRSDGVDLVGELKKQYNFVRSVGEINAAAGKVICIDETMDDMAEESNLTLLADATRASITKLEERSDNGFFLMVEGAKIDYAGHSRTLPASVIESLSFDLAVAEALRFADQNGETLVVVTADHETGGLVLLDGNEQTGHIMGIYTTDDHTPMMLPVFAYGPGADKFCGTYMNTEIARKIKLLTE